MGRRAWAGEEGWRRQRTWKLRPGYIELPVVEARTSLLREKWKWYGLIDPWAVPGSHSWREGPPPGRE